VNAAVIIGINYCRLRLVAVTDVYGLCETLEMPPTPPPSSSNCSSDSEGGSLSPERSAPPSPSSSPYFTRTHLAFHAHSSSSHHSSLWTSSHSSAQQALFTSPVRANICKLGVSYRYYHHILLKRTETV